MKVFLFSLQVWVVLEIWWLHKGSLKVNMDEENERKIKIPKVSACNNSDRNQIG